MFHVIIADDDINVRKGFKTLIDWDSIGAELVLVSKDGKEVIDFLEKNRTDLVISDVRMPFVDGIELSEYVKNNCPYVRVVLMSAFADFEYCQKALSYGVADYILKPIDRKKIKHITEMIQKMSAEKNKLVRLDGLLYDADFKKSFRKAVSNKDIETAKILMRQGEAHIVADFSSVRSFYLFILNEIYEINNFTQIDLRSSEVYSRFNEIYTTGGFSPFICEELEKCFSQEDDLLARKNKVSTVEKVKAYIDHNYMKSDLSVNSIAEFYNLSASYVGTIFKTKYLLTINEYIFIRRIEKACDLLLNTESNIRTISKMVGYADEKYFVRLFKKYTGKTPTEYRITGGSGLE